MELTSFVAPGDNELGAFWAKDLVPIRREKKKARQNETILFACIACD